MLMTLILFHLLLYHFSSIFTLEKFYLIITSSILWILCFWLQFKMIEVMKYAKYMQIYAFQSSFLGYHSYICISSSVYPNLYHIFSTLLTGDVTNWIFCIPYIYVADLSFGDFNDIFRLFSSFWTSQKYSIIILIIKMIKASVFVFSLQTTYGWWWYDFILLELFSLGCISHTYIIPQRNLLPPEYKLPDL